MFTWKKDATPSSLDKEIERLLTQMTHFGGDDAEYAKMADQLEKLYKLKAIDKPDRVDANTLALIAGNLAGIVMIVGYERANIVTSKALGFVRQLR